MNQIMLLFPKITVDSDADTPLLFLI
jgi:hypothetical protein